MKKILMGFCFLVAMAVLLAWIPGAYAFSSYYTGDTTGNCDSCHGSTPNTCAGCHAHGVHSSSAKSDLNITGTTNKTTYSPGETVSVTIDGDYRSGWVRAILYDQGMNELARSTGTVVPPAIAPSGGPSFPITLNAPAPMTPGPYTWRVSWYGNDYDTGTAFFGPDWTPDTNNPGHGEEIVSTNSFTVASVTTSSKIGVYSNGTWFHDLNGNGAWNGALSDRQSFFGYMGAIPVSGDWDGLNGITEIGVYDNGTWYLDLNANGVWDGTPTDLRYFFGFTGAIPVTGDWNGDGATEIGVYDNGTWYLDLNANGVWDGTPTDLRYFFGFTGAIPVTGDWDISGATEIGVYDNGVWYLDYNGSGTWDSTPIDVRSFFGFPGAIPVTGDWNGSGATKIGVYADPRWYLDLNGNGAWNGTPTDAQYSFGFTGAIPVTGKW